MQLVNTGLMFRLLAHDLGHQTPMVSYVNVHAVLENRRKNARDAMPSAMPGASQRADSAAATSQVIIYGLLFHALNTL
jgi:hypothetical protein